MFTQKWSKIKSSLYSRCYAEACIEWRAHLHGLAPGQHSSEEAVQRRRAIADTVSDLKGLGFEPIFTTR